MIHLIEQQKLLLKYSTHPNRPAHLSAASGLVQVGQWLYVIADDELHLGKFLLNGDGEGDLYPCFEGDLPVDADQRKEKKPDTEALLLISEPTNPLQPALLALGSGSKSNRCLGAIIPLDQQGNLAHSPRLIDLSYFYRFLSTEIGKLNIEGACIQQDSVYLFQRGNSTNSINASIKIPLDSFYKLLIQPSTNFQPQIQITPYDLGTIDQVPLCFTDATALTTGEILFTASAENTSDAYLDGACMGSVIGIINSQGDICRLESIDKKIKLEGISAKQHNTHLELLLVADADDANHPASLYSVGVNWLENN